MIYSYRDNLLGLVIPPEINDLVNNRAQTGMPFELPQIQGEPQISYDAEAGIASLSFNFNNPLDIPISFDQFTAGIVYKGDNTFLGNLTINEPIMIQPGQTEQIKILGNIPQETVSNLNSKYGGLSEDELFNSLRQYSLVDVNINVGGIIMHVDRLDASDLRIFG